MNNSWVSNLKIDFKALNDARNKKFLERTLVRIT